MEVNGILNNKEAKSGSKNIMKIPEKIKNSFYRAFLAVFVFYFLWFIVNYTLLIFLMPKMVFSLPLRLILDLALAILALYFTRKVRILARQNQGNSRKLNTKKLAFVSFLIMVVFFGGLIGYYRIQSIKDEQYVKTHVISFNAIKHGNVPASQYYSTIKRVQSTLDSLRAQYKATPLGTPLKEIDLYPDHDTFVIDTGITSTTVAFFQVVNGNPTIFIPVDLFLIQPESIAHEVMHAFMYEELGNDYLNIPLWFHDGMAQLYSFSGMNLVDQRVKTNVGLWSEKPNVLLSPDFILNRLNYPGDDESIYLFYSASFSLTDFLNSKDNRHLFTDIVVEMSKGISFDEAFKNVTHGDVEKTYYDWVNQCTGLTN